MREAIFRLIYGWPAAGPFAESRPAAESEVCTGQAISGPPAVVENLM